MTFVITSNTEGNRTVKVGTYDMMNPAINPAITGSITIPQSVNYEEKEYSVTTLGCIAFYNSLLTEVILPEGLTTIEGSAFSYCPNLKKVIIPSTVTKFGKTDVVETEGGPFEECNNLAYITFKSSNISFEEHSMMFNLNTVIIMEAEIPPTLDANNGQYVFEDGVGLHVFSKIIVPDGSKESYKSANGWNSVADKIYGNSQYTIVTDPTIILSETSYTYDGTEKKPTVTVKNGNTTIPESEYTVSYSNNTEAGTAKVTIINKEGGNYIVNGSTTFSILGTVPSGNIEFAIPKVKAACVSKWDTNHDGELSYAEAAAVTCLVEDYDNEDDPFYKLLFDDPDFTSFDEFQYFTGITSLETSDGPLFGGCKYLTSIKLSESITSIGKGAFYECPLTSIHIPASVTNIFMGDNDGTAPAFNSQYLQTIIVDSENTKYTSPEGSNAIIDKESNTLILGCENTTIPSTVTTIGQHAFEYAVFPESKTSITLSETITGIMEYAFAGSNITSINLGDLAELKTLGDYAFQNCTGLTEATIPASIENRIIRDPEDPNYVGINGPGMGSGVFADCSNIIKIVSKIEEPFKISKDSYYDFNFCTENAVLYVPSGKVDAYISAGWEEIISDDLKSFRKIVDGDYTAPEAIEGLAYNGTDQKLILPGSYRTGMMEYSLDGSTYSKFVPTGKSAGSYTVYYRKVGESDASTLTATIASKEEGESSTFTAKTTEGWDMVFTVLDEGAKTCQVGYLDGSFDKPAIDRDAVEGTVTIPGLINGYTVVKIGKSAFDNAVKMSSVTIPESVTTIDDNAFGDCWGLTTFELPASVTTIGQGALSGFNNVTSISVAEGNPNYDSRNNCNAIIEKATNKLLLGSKKTIIPASVKEIGSGAFSGFEYTLTIPSTVTKIEFGAFSMWCERLTLWVEHTTPLVINENVFRNLKNSTLLVPAGCKAAYAAATGWNLFDKIEEGTTAKTKEGWDMVFTILDESAKTCQVGYLEGSWVNVSVNRDVVKGHVTIPETVNGYTVVKIGKSAFYNLWEMTSVTIPNTVTFIDENAFEICFGLTTLEFPASVTEIGGSAFSGLNNCTIIMPSSITKIGDKAFASSSNLTLQVEHTTPLVINENVFGDMSNSTLRVPAGSKSAYAAATGWKEFKEIQELVSPSDMFVFTANPDGTTCSVTSFTKYCNGDVTIPESWEGLSVTSIGRNAFFCCSGLTSVTIPNSVTSIDEGAFFGCSDLTSLTIPSSITSIGDDAFLDCTSLTSVTIPISVTSIGDHIFKGCSNLTSLNVEAGNTKYDSRDNCNAIIETETNTLICGIPNTTIPNSVTSIGEAAFYECKNLTSVTIPNSVTSIGSCSFEYCSGLTSIVIPNSVISIGSLAFAGCSGLTSLTIPNSVTSIADGAFAWCSGLNSMIVEAGNTKYDSRDNSNAIIETETNTIICGTKNTVIPNSVISIGEMALSGSGLTSINIPNCISSVGKLAFSYCDGLTSLTIPNSVTSIGDMSFYDCNNLTSVTVKAKTPITISKEVFPNRANAKLYVPKGSKAAYLAADYWKEFASIEEFTVTTLTAKSYTRTYGENNPTFDYDVTGGTVTGTPTITCAATATSNVGTYDIVITKGTITNNDVTFVNGTLTITSKTVSNPTIILSQTSFTYDGSAKKPTVILKDGETVISAEEYTVGYSNNTNVGTATVTISNKEGGNYIVSGSTTFAISAADCILTPPTGKTGLIYTGSAQNLMTVGSTTTGTLQYSLDGTNYGTKIPQGTNAKEYTVYYKVKGDANHNDVAAKSLKVTIAKAPLKITAKSYTRKQGEANPEFSVAYEGFKNNETNAVLTTKPKITCAATQSSAAGTYDIIVSGASATNYSISYVIGKLTVEAVTPEPEPEGTTFDVDTDESSKKEVQLTFVVNGNNGSGTPTVAITDDKDASGSISIPEKVTHNGVEYKVTEIGAGSFQNNTTLTEVTIPSSIVSIGASAFAGCTNLQSITINIIIPINLSAAGVRGFTRADGSSVFDGVNKETCILYVPEGSVDKYKAAPVWKEFKNILSIKTSTGINDIEQTDGEPFDVYNLSGRKVRSKVTSLDGLPRGIYIINGKKVVK